MTVTTSAETQIIIPYIELKVNNRNRLKDIEFLGSHN